MHSSCHEPLSTTLEQTTGVHSSVQIATTVYMFFQSILMTMIFVGVCLLKNTMIHFVSQGIWNQDLRSQTFIHHQLGFPKLCIWFGLMKLIFILFTYLRTLMKTKNEFSPIAWFIKFLPLPFENNSLIYIVSHIAKHHIHHILYSTHEKNLHLNWYCTKEKCQLDSNNWGCWS